MGYHFINPSIKGFDVRSRRSSCTSGTATAGSSARSSGSSRQKPATPPLKGATYGSFPAACHYKDGTFVAQPSADACAPKSPQSGAAFNFWHPALVTMHVWIWYPNPAGLYASMNPLVPAFK